MHNKTVNVTKSEYYFSIKAKAQYMQSWIDAPIDIIEQTFVKHFPFEIDQGKPIPIRAVEDELLSKGYKFVVGKTYWGG